MKNTIGCWVSHQPYGIGAATIAPVYKERWQIELFFRALKQSLRVKTFVGLRPCAENPTLAGADRHNCW